MRRQLVAPAMALAIAMGGGVHATTTKAAAEKQTVELSCNDPLGCLFSRSAVNSDPTVISVPTGIGGAGDHATVEVILWKDASKYAPGSIVVHTRERRLYYVISNDNVRRYRIGVGREGFQWSGSSRIVAKQEWPTWHPPQEMIKREAAKGYILPEEMPGGPRNPLGARAMYIGGTMYRIHGNNNAASVGDATSSGCIRMMNADVMELYGRVKIGTPVYVFQ